MVFHEQNIRIDEPVMELEQHMSQLGYPQHYIHTGPLIRKEDDYEYLELDIRKKIMKQLMTFFRSTEVLCHSFYVDKKHLNSEEDLTQRLQQRIEGFLQNNLLYFNNFDKVIIYYDNGQVELTRLLVDSFRKYFNNMEFRKVIPSDYRLFQIADLACTLQLELLKVENRKLTKSDLLFFQSERVLRKNYLKPLEKKTL